MLALGVGIPQARNRETMGDYSEMAEFYDALYEDVKDYAAESSVLANLIREARPQARTLLDVGCGPGAHARHLTDAGFDVDGVDIEPTFVEACRSRCPEGSFTVGDMRTLDLPDRYDAVLCLFSAIGYMLDEASLDTAVERMARHLVPGGVLVIDPWFEPGEMDHGWIATTVGKTEDTTVCRMSRTVIEGNLSRLEFEYLIGTVEGIERRSEVHELALFSQAQMEAAFAHAGLDVERKEKFLRTRGAYVGTSSSPS